MKIISRLTILLLIILSIACGKQKNPAGGPEDKSPLKIVSISPENYNSISGKEIEILFNKSLDRKSVTNSFQFYPPLDSYQIETSTRSVKITIEDSLKANQNIYFTILDIVKDTRNNTLEMPKTYIYSNGKLQDTKITGIIRYEKEEDSKLDKELILLDADSISMFSKTFKRSSFDIDGLDSKQYVLRCYIDKTNNGRYNIEKEPYYETLVDSTEIRNVELYLSYADTTRVLAKSAKAIYNNLVEIKLSEVPEFIDDIEIICLKDTTNLKIEFSDLDQDILNIVTTNQDTTMYEIRLKDIFDSNDNKTDLTVKTFQGSVKADTLAPELLSTSPRNGSSVYNSKPQFSLVFNEIIKSSDFVSSLKEIETGRIIATKIIKANSHNVIIEAQKELKNYNSYLLTISSKTKDLSGNRLIDDVLISFMVTLKSDS